MYGLARVDDHGQAEFDGERHLCREHLMLRMTRREVVVIVQANLADGAGVEPVRLAPGGIRGIQRTAGERPGVVGMHTRREPYGRPSFTDPHRPPVLRIVAGGENAEGLIHA